jgi:hypothetical protein
MGYFPKLDDPLLNNSEISSHVRFREISQETKEAIRDSESPERKKNKVGVLCLYPVPFPEF